MTTLMVEPKSASDAAALTPDVDTHHIQLDGLRALAVIGVMIEHYFPETEAWIKLGSMGVRVFFVLSGFLITGILLRARKKVETGEGTTGLVLRRFYIRRFLRIFPLFYGVLLVGYVIGLPPVVKTWPWHASYLSNVYNFRRGPYYDAISHFWSLAVEEQFYLVWPLLILCLPRRAILPVVTAAVLTGPLFRAGMLWRGYTGGEASALTPACLDTLGMGALSAVVVSQFGTRVKDRFLKIAILAGLPMLIVTHIAIDEYHSDWLIVPWGLSIGLSGAWLIDRACRGFKGVAGKFLTLKPLTYIGIISYGVYVIHNLIGAIVVRSLAKIGFNPPSEWLRAACMTALTLILASLSWHFYEKPINLWKRHFPYTDGARKKVSFIPLPAYQERDEDESVMPSV